jgi:H+/Cl- antiporter ClcA
MWPKEREVERAAAVGQEFDRFNKNTKTGHTLCDSDISGGGRLQAMVAIVSGSNFLSWQNGVVRLFCSSLYLIAGNTMGMDGPLIIFCCSLFQIIGKRFNLRGRSMQSALAGTGAACGIAIVFNAPVTGIIYAVEEIGSLTPYILSKTVTGVR